MIQQYGVLPSNLAFAKLQSLPVYIWNPIRNLFETKEDKLDPVDPPTPEPTPVGSGDPAPTPVGPGDPPASGDPGV